MPLSKFLARICAIVVCLAAVLPAFAQDTIQSLYEAAKTEGKLVYWGSPDTRTAALLKDRFKAKYPGIEIDLFKIQPAPAIERIIEAASAGRAVVDVMDSQLAYLELLFDRKMVVSYPWVQNFQIDPTRVLFDGRALTLWHLDTPLAINTGLVKAGEIKSWDDLLDPKWRRKLIVEARGFSFAILALKWSETRAFDYLKSIMALNPIITKGGTATIEALSGGQGAVGIGAYAGIVEQFKDAGAPIDWVRVGPVPTAFGALLQLANAPHPNAARLWMHFMMSQEAHDAIYEGMGLDIVYGRNVGPLGAKYQASSLEVVPESFDLSKMKALIARAAAAIGSL